MLRYLWEASFLVKKKSSISVLTEFGQNRHKNLLWCIYKNHIEVESKWDFTCSIIRIAWFFWRNMPRTRAGIIKIFQNRNGAPYLNCAFWTVQTVIIVKKASALWNILFLTLFLALSFSCTLLSFSWENCLVWVFTLSWHALSRAIRYSMD